VVREVFPTFKASFSEAKIKVNYLIVTLRQIQPKRYERITAVLAGPITTYTLELKGNFLEIKKLITNF
jgi:hypothetical protein